VNAKVSLRGFSFVRAAYAVVLIVLAVVRARAFAEIERGVLDGEAIEARFAALAHLWTVGSVCMLVATVLCVGAYLATAWKERGRSLALGGIVAALVYGALVY